MDQYFRTGIKSVAIRSSSGEILWQNIGTSYEGATVKVFDQIALNLFKIASKSSKYTLCLNGKNRRRKMLTTPCPIITALAERWGSGDSE